MRLYTYNETYSIHADTHFAERHTYRQQERATRQDRQTSIARNYEKRQIDSRELQDKTDRQALLEAIRKDRQTAREL
jgi:hypothetical protein